MPADTFACPDCQARLRRSADATPGTTVRCPRCSLTFPVPPLEQELAVPPQAGTPPQTGGESAYAEGRGAPRRENEPADLFADQPRPGANRLDRDEAVRPRRYEEDDEDYPRSARDSFDNRELPTDYKVEMGRWFSYAQDHYGDFFGPALGYCLILFLINLVIGVLPIVGPLASAILNPPLQAGLFVVALRQLKGKAWTFGDFFSGFNWMGQTIGLNLLAGLIVVGVALPGILAGIITLVVMAQNSRGGDLPPEALLIASPFFLLSFCLAIYFAIRVSFFSLPLIIDRDFGITEAIGGSWKLTRGHFWPLFGVSFVLGLINLGGAMLCGVGVLFTVPYTILAMTAGYLLIAGSRPPVSRGAARAGDELD